MKEKTINKIGEININTNGTKMKISEFYNCNNIVVEFENGYKTKTTYNNFNKGNVKNLYDKTVCGIGYLGEGKYRTREHNKLTKEYQCWRDMIYRCYNYLMHKDHPTYEDATVCEEWLCYQNFAEWYNENYYTVDDEQMQLDKDILHKGNKIYSPENCVFVPKYINTLFTQRGKDRGDCPIGVYFKKSNNKYNARLSKGENKMVHLGYFNSKIEAFYKYKDEKEKFIKEVTNKYKNKIPNKLYESLYNWKIEITD